MEYYSWERAGVFADRKRTAWKYILDKNIPLEVSFREAIELCKAGETLIVSNVAITAYSTDPSFRAPFWITETCTYLGNGVYKRVNLKLPVPSIKTQNDLYTLLDHYRGGCDEKTV